MSIIDVEERAGCFAWLVFLVSSDCCVALPRGAMGLSVLIVVFTDHTHYFCCCSRYMFCCTLLYVHSSFAIILMGKREQVALLSLSS